MPRLRHALALLLVAALAAWYFVPIVLGNDAWWQDLDPPAAIFHSLSLAGLAVGCFWARFLAICFYSILTGVWTLMALRYGVDGTPAIEWLRPAAMIAVVALLSGASMRARFEGRPGRFNRWAGTHPRLLRLRWLILAQAVLLELAYGGRFLSAETTLALLLLGAAGIVGLVWLKTWGLLLTSVSCVVQAVLVGHLVRGALTPPAQPWIFDPRPSLALAALLTAVPLALSLRLLVPWARPIIARLRG